MIKSIFQVVFLLFVCSQSIAYANHMENEENQNKLIKRYIGNKCVPTDKVSCLQRRDIFELVGNQQQPIKVKIGLGGRRCKYSPNPECAGNHKLRQAKSA